MRKQKGFTLIELVVVVMILGILAAVAAPKLLGTSSAAADNGLKQTLSVVRDAIERYAAEHAGALPGDPAELVTNGYLRGAFPICPVGGDALIRTVTSGTAAPGTGVGGSWAYSSEDGTFICNSHDDTKSDSTVKYDAL